MSNCVVVPWVNTEEWLKVMNLIYSENPDENEALKWLLLWKARCPSLPSGIESTLILLQVHIQDLNSPDDNGNDHVLRLAYSSAIMRFINHMLDVSITKENTLSKAAKNVGIPDWIVELRHDTAHNNNLPSLSLLRDATQFGLDWLKSNYWKEHKLLITDYKSGRQETDSQEETRVMILVNFCISLSICSNSECKIKTLADIVDVDMRDSIINDARDLIGDKIELSNLRQVTISTLIDKMNYHGKFLLKSKNARKYVNKALLGDESLILSLDTFNYFGTQPQKRHLKLKKKYIHCFEVLIRCLHLNDLLLEFIMGLIKISQESNEQRANLAALWISEIFSAFRKRNHILKKMEKNKYQGHRTHEELKALYRHWFPNYKSGIVFDLNKPIPMELQNIHFIQPIISTYNPFLNYFVKEILHLVEPPLPDIVTNKICELAKLISTPLQNFVTSSSRIYTIDDIKSSQDTIDLTESLQNEQELNECKSKGTYQGNGIWELVSDHFQWSACPIGKLPCSYVEQMET
ncbi:uncharacterized protein LOC114241030 isoform X1 [Bombyx mandarina]|uniref:Uncharacterized protein LOC114241030 isoform X1 n=2 Tax=Bombyx mandarina TaxID=7092 RepID=A0A6J2JDI8_BOMMA|nr:uncharacterized protein LOC114241030 isoform X1 [Bombyx mandarina]